MDLKDYILENICIWIKKLSKWKASKTQWNDLSWSILSFHDRPETDVGMREISMMGSSKSYHRCVQPCSQICRPGNINFYWPSKRKPLILEITYFGKQVIHYITEILIISVILQNTMYFPFKKKKKNFVTRVTDKNFAKLHISSPLRFGSSLPSSFSANWQIYFFLLELE